VGTLFRGWARSVSGDAAEGICLIEEGLKNLWATGTMVTTPLLLALKAEALHLANHTTEALKAIREAETSAEKRQERWWCAELHRLRGVFIAAIGGKEVQIEASFCDAIRIAQEQKPATSLVANDQARCLSNSSFEIS
jgi:predicted ATPase